MDESSTSTTTSMSLPPEVLMMIINKLSVSDKCQCTLVCKDWYDKICNKLVWRNATFTWTPDSDLSEGSSTRHLIQRGIRHLTIKGKWNKGSFSLGPLPLNGLIQFLSQVETLNIDYRYIMNDIFNQPSFLLAMPLLTKLTFVDCNSTINGCVEEITRNLTNLVNLEFRRGVYSSVVMTDDSLLHIARNLGKLTHLAIDNCGSITDLGIAHLTHHGEDKNYNLARLQYLSLGGCRQLTDTSMSYLSVGQPNLKYLCIANTEEITNLGIAHLSKLEHLQEFVYLPRFTIIADKEMDYLATLRQLSVLRFRCRKWTCMLEYRQLAKMDNLRVLELHNFDFLEKTMWSHFAKMPNLCELSLHDSLIRDNNLNVLADAKSQLVKLEIIGCSNLVTDDCLQHISRLSHLQELTLINCGNIQETGLAYLATGAAKITVFKVGNYENVTPFSALVHIAGLKHLRALTWFAADLDPVDEHIDSFKRNRPDVYFQLKRLECFKTGLEQEFPHLRFRRNYL